MNNFTNFTTTTYEKNSLQKQLKTYEICKFKIDVNRIVNNTNQVQLVDSLLTYTPVLQLTDNLTGLRAFTDNLPQIVLPFICKVLWDVCLVLY